MVTSKPVALMTPNLAELGVPRRAPIGNADLETIWLTPYPVITNYIAFCHSLHIPPFNGGTRQLQGSWGNGSISSGYRSEKINNNIESPHRYGFALDIIFLTGILEASRAASLYFNRVGIYPDRKFIHVDLAPVEWIRYHHKRRHWVNFNNEYHYFDDITDALVKAEELMNP